METKRPAPKRGRPKGQPAKAEVLERENEVVKLRRSGLTWHDIATRVGYADPTGAKLAFDRANRRVIQEDIDEIRNLENERLDVAQSAIWGEVLTGDNQAVNTLIRIMERRAKLLGLDQPIRIQQEVITYDGDTIRGELERIINSSRANSGPPVLLAEPVSETEPVTAGD